jgi:predicted nucleic acid-binding protein
MILVDTNIFIEYYKNNPEICKILEQIDPVQLVVNDIICAELYYGARNRQELASIVADMEKFTVLPINPKISRFSVSLVKEYCLSHKLKLPDAQIAATALLHDAELFTLNLKDFEYIPALRLYYWR